MKLFVVMAHVVDVRTSAAKQLLVSCWSAAAWCIAMCCGRDGRLMAVAL
jgi:hypothetical protein